MIPEALLPNISNFALERLELSDNCLNIFAKITEQFSYCPLCEKPSQKPHSAYSRHLADLPWAGFVVKVILKVQKYFCHNDNCGRKIFTQRLEGLPEYARRTERQADQLLAIGMAAGGNGGARLSSKLGVPTSASTLLRLMNTQPIENYETPRVLGVDDWAMRKGQKYGTILVDLEKQRPIDLLPDREADTLQEWLEQHPGVEIISRDRASAYSEGATKGAPNAIQVADRWHLLKNLTDALKLIMDKHNKASRLAAREIAIKRRKEQGLDPLIVKNGEDIGKVAPKKEAKKPPLKYELMFEQVKALQKQGFTRNAIAEQIGVSRRTITRYYKYDSYPERPKRESPPSTVAPYYEYLRKRWSEKEFNTLQLWREIQQQGFTGSSNAVHRYLRRNFDKQTNNIIALDLKVYSARKISFLLSKETEKLKEKEVEYLEHLFKHYPEAKQANQLALRYREIIVKKKAKLLAAWIEDAKQSGKQILQGFAKNMLKDFEAIYNACSLKWSNGQVEGQINRLKNIKRQMYGRASFNLLKKKVLSDTS